MSSAPQLSRHRRQPRRGSSDIFRDHAHAILGGCVAVISAMILGTAVLGGVHGGADAYPQGYAEAESKPGMVSRTSDVVRGSLPVGHPIEDHVINGSLSPGSAALVEFSVNPAEDATGVEASGPQRNRQAYVVVGRNYDPNQPMPLVFAVGGWKDNPENLMSYARIDQSGMGDDAIVVYPRGLKDAWEGAPYSESKQGEDVAFVKRMVTDLSASLNVDLARVFGLGMSNGGGMVTTVACRAPELFAGFVSISGAYYHPTMAGCDPAERTSGEFFVPALLIHGDEDRRTQYAGGLLHEAPYYGVRDVAKQLAQLNKCDDTPLERDLTGEEYGPEDKIKPDTVTELRYESCVAPVTHWQVHGKGHKWYYSPDTAGSAWNFFKAVSKL